MGPAAPPPSLPEDSGSEDFTSLGRESGSTRGTGRPVPMNSRMESSPMDFDGSGDAHTPVDLKGWHCMLITYCLAGWLACSAPSDLLDEQNESTMTESVKDNSGGQDLPTKASPSVVPACRTNTIPPEPSGPANGSSSLQHGRQGSRTAGRVRAMSTLRAGSGVSVPRLVACNRPPWFEDSNLERSGRSSGDLLQPVVSGAHFFGSVGVLPLKILQAGPHRMVCPQDDAREAAPVSRVWNLLSPAPGFELQEFSQQER